MWPGGGGRGNYVVFLELRIFLPILRKGKKKKKKAGERLDCLFLVA